MNPTGAKYRALCDLIRAAEGYQQATACTREDARVIAAQMLGVPLPDVADIRAALVALARTPARRRRGAPLYKPSSPNAPALTKRDAVAAVACYFESIGAGKEQARIDAMRWLSVTVSRKVGHAAIKAYRETTAPNQLRIQAEFARAVFCPADARKLPVQLTRSGRKATAPPVAMPAESEFG